MEDIGLDEYLEIEENDDKSEFFWDIKRQKYVSLFKDTQEIQIVEKEHIKRHYFNKSPENWKL